MSQFVLDASVALAWVLDVPIPVYALEVRRDMLSGKRGLVPALWHLEIANGLATAERRRDLSAVDAEDALDQILVTCSKQTRYGDEFCSRARRALAMLVRSS